MISLLRSGNLEMKWDKGWRDMHSGFDEDLFKERLSTLCCLQCLNLNMLTESPPEQDSGGVGKTRCNVILLVKELGGGRGCNSRPAEQAFVQLVGFTATVKSPDPNNPAASDAVRTQMATTIWESVPYLFHSTTSTSLIGAMKTNVPSKKGCIFLNPCEPTGSS